MRTFSRRVHRVELLRPKRVTVDDILHSPAWWELRGVIIEALAPFPEARFALAAQLQQLGEAGLLPESTATDQRERGPAG
jgi:hypothetical protein